MSDGVKLIWIGLTCSGVWVALTEFRSVLSVNEEIMDGSGVLR
jgi:hypothetical protein